MTRHGVRTLLIFALCAIILCGCRVPQPAGAGWEALYEEITGRKPGEQLKPSAAEAAVPNPNEQVAEIIGGLLDDVGVVADETTNTLLLRGSPRDLENLKRLVASLDRPRPQVLIRVFIAEVTLDDTTELGVEWDYTDHIDGVFKTGRGGDETLQISHNLEGRGATLTPSLRYTLETDKLLLRVHALNRKGKVNVLSRPQILTLDNQEASINIGEEVPFIRNTRVTDVGTTFNTIEYEDVGIILTVTPHINPNGWVLLDINLEISKISDSTVTISQGVTAPIISKREAITSVVVKDGQTIVTGGLMRDTTEDTVRSIPFLGRIPLLGQLFRYRKTEVKKTELLIFLTPTILKNAQELRRMSGKMMDRAKLLPGAVNLLEPKAVAPGRGKEASSTARQSR